VAASAPAAQPSAKGTGETDQEVGSKKAGRKKEKAVQTPEYGGQGVHITAERKLAETRRQARIVDWPCRRVEATGLSRGALEKGVYRDPGTDR
jgi:hypothetical protein